MELKRYFQIFQRYWLVIAVLTLIGAVAAGQFYLGNRTTYQAVAQVAVNQVPITSDNYSGIYANQSSDYVIDDLALIIPGNRFMELVSNQLREASISLSPEALKGMVEIERKHRILTLTVNGNSPAETVATARAIADTVINNANTFLEPRKVTTSLVNMPTTANPSGGRALLLAFVRLLAGIIAGVALAFLLAYLDSSVKSADDAAAATGLKTIGVVPSFRAVTGNNSTAVQAGGQGTDQMTQARLQSLADSENNNSGTKPTVQTSDSDSSAVTRK